MACLIPDPEIPVTTGGEQPVRVGIGLIGRYGRYLIRRRLPGSPMAGLWEFPGGKCKPGESPADAAARECLEEVGIEVVVGSLFHQVIHNYPHGLVELHYFRCSTERMEDQPGVDSGFVWVSSEDLAKYHFPEANESVIDALAREGDQFRGSRRDEP